MSSRKTLAYDIILAASVSQLEKTLINTNWKDGFALRSWTYDVDMRKIGEGNHAEVYALDQKKVVKLTYGDDCWDDYAKFIQKNKSNKYLPKISHHRMYEGRAETPRGYSTDFFTVTIMERLHPLSYVEITTTNFWKNRDIEEKIGIMYAAAAKNGFNITLRETIYDSMTEKEKRAVNISLGDIGEETFILWRKTQDALRKFLASRNHPLTKILLKIEDLGKSLPYKCLLDVHSENFMLRGKQIVLTDPLYRFRN